MYFTPAMTFDQIGSIVANGKFPGPKKPAEIVETHISWVILTPSFAFKIKKPVEFPFLDFSTVEKREYYCGEELRLNRRLAPSVYLDVLPVCSAVDGLPEIFSAIDGRTPLDFAVWMKRLDNACQMDRMLEQDRVTDEHMRELARLLAGFHESVFLNSGETMYRPDDNRKDFNDLFRLKDTAVRFFGPETAAQFDTWRQQAGNFLDRHEARLRWRARAGCWVDGHGDLHARNIFLLPDGPVIFDCIDFNPHFRQGDLLNELAFLCMDLEVNGHYALAKVFMDAYCTRHSCIEGPEDAYIFLYFKTYRANVRLKVTLTELEQHEHPALLDTARNYLSLFAHYMQQLPG